MAVTLEGIDITGLVLTEDFGSNIQGVVQTANDGSLIVYEQEISFNDKTLMGGDDWGWLSYTILNQLKALANVIGATYTLDYDGTVYIVRFKSEDIPVISGDKLINRSNTDNEDFYNNIMIKLMEV